MAEWVPLRQHSDNSLRLGLPKPEKIVARCAELGYTAAAITDVGVLGGVPALLKAAKKANIKGIAGTEFHVCEKDATVHDETNKDCHSLCVLGKGLAGWKGLMRASASSHRPEHAYFRPRLDLPRIASGSDFIVLSGFPGSELANVCFENYKNAYLSRTYDEVRGMVRGDWKKRVTECIRRHQELFGKDNFYVAIQLTDQKNVPASLVVARILRSVCKELNVPRVATADSYYCRRDDAADQRVLICAALETTMSDVGRKLANSDPRLSAFFRSSNYHVPEPAEIRELHADHPEELATSLEIAVRCESFSVDGPPLLPDFPCPDGMSADDYLEKLCREGWDRKIEKKVRKSLHPEYHERLFGKELPVFRSTSGFLSNYSLIVRDLIRFANEDLGVKTGLGRGSAAGCLISYLVGITRLDPMKFSLSFERYYNSGRNSPGRIQLPDIDTDFPIYARDPVIAYAMRKYGEDRVCQMATFNRMQGRGAIKGVLRANGRCDYETMNKITESVPDESSILDQLQVMREETGEASIVRYALEHFGDELREWAWLDKDGNVDGPLGLDFAQAIRLEGTKMNMGKHPSGLVICGRPVAEISPMVWDKSSERMMTGVDMRDAESIGLPKVDILGLRSLDCIRDAESLVRTGRPA